MLEVNQLRCERGERTLFSNLSFSLNSGELLHIQGANGSGKTSLMKLLAMLSRPVEGEISWQGVNIEKTRPAFLSEVLYLGHKSGIKANLSAEQNLQLNCRIHSYALSPSDKTLGDRITEALQQVGLQGFEDIPAYALSMGQKRRIALARLLLESKKIWILDEPFTALDLAAVNMVEKLFTQHLQNEGMVILSSHQELQDNSESLHTLDLAEFAFCSQEQETELI